MAYFFKHFPDVEYNLSGSRIVQNPLVRFKLKELLKGRAALFYTHNIEDGQGAEYIAHRYYDDETLDWLIFITNDIIDPLYDWPLEYQDFIKFIKTKYGSVAAAQQETHHYEKICQMQRTMADGTTVPERVIKVDETTYNSLSPSLRKHITTFDHEDKLNNDKRVIKILKKEYVPSILNEVESIFK